MLAVPSRPSDASAGSLCARTKMVNNPIIAFHSWRLLSFRNRDDVRKGNNPKNVFKCTNYRVYPNLIVAAKKDRMTN